MKIKLIHILFFALTVFTVKAQDYPFSLPSDMEAAINITSSSKEVYNNLLLGTNIHGFKTDEEQDLIKKLDPITIRFPHGLWSNWYDWRRDVTRLFGEESFDYKQGTNGAIKTKTVDLLANIKIFDAGNIKVGIDGVTSLNSQKKVAQGKGFDMMWTFNMSADGVDFNNGSPETMARYNDLISRGLEVKAIELGNECFYPGQRSSIIPNAEDYIARAKSMSAALKAKDPAIKVSVPLLRKDSWANPNWNTDLTTDLNYFDAVTVHTYIGSDPDNAADSDEAFGVALTARKHLGNSIYDYAHKVAPNKPIWLTEWGVKSGGPNAVSALGMVDCYIFMSQNQNVFERANWFSVNGQLNSHYVWETYVSPSGVVRPRIKYPLEKTVFGSAYQIIRSVLENGTMLESQVDVENLVDGVKAVNARVVWKDGKATVFVVNLSNQDVPFSIGIDGGTFNDSYVHKAMSFSTMDEERAIPIDQDPLTLIKEGNGNVVLPKYSINTIELASLDNVPLGSNVFTVQTLSETCADSDNGKIVIEAVEKSKDYKVTLSGSDYDLTDNLTIDKLTPGVYNLCITKNDENFEQCYELTVEAAEALAGKISVEKNKVTVDIEQGSAPFSLIKNGELILTTNETNFEVNVAHGDQIEVQSAAVCQGLLSEKINMLEAVKAYPNPTRGLFDIYIPTEKKNINIEVYNMYSQLVSAKIYEVIGGKVHIDIANKAQGVYFVKVPALEGVVIKVVKQ